MKTVRSLSVSTFSPTKKYPSAPKELPPNKVSIEAEKQNRLSTRVKPFIA